MSQPTNEVFFSNLLQSLQLDVFSGMMAEALRLSVKEAVVSSEGVMCATAGVPGSWGKLLTPYVEIGCAEQCHCCREQL